MGDDSWDCSDFLKRYTTKAVNGNHVNGNHMNNHTNHFNHTNNHNDEEMNSSIEGGDDIYTPYTEEPSAFCTNNNIEERLMFLNQELCTLGFPPIVDNAKNPDLTRLVNCTYELIRTHSRQVKMKDDLEAGQTRLNNDNDILLQSQDRLKQEIESLKNENALSLYREKELQKKCACLQQEVKNEREEKRKMKSDIDQVRNQFYHETKRREKEITRLKDKLNQALSDKSSQNKVLIDVLNPLPRSDGKRGKWNVGSKKIREEEMYKLLIANYEEKEQVLVAENRGMRETLNDIHKSLFHMDPATAATEMYEDEGRQYQMPYHLVKEDINSKLHNLLNYLQKKLENGGNKSTPITVPSRAEVRTEDQQTNTNDTTNNVDNEKLKELTFKLEQYKQACLNQEKVLEGMKEGYNEEAFEKLLKLFGSRDEDMAEQDERRRLLQEDIRKYEQDRKEFTAYVAQIAKEKEEFDHERVEFYMHRISTPVLNKELHVPLNKGVKSPTQHKSPSTPNFVSAPCRSGSGHKKQKTPSTGDLYKYLSLSYDSTSPKKFAGYPVDGSFNEQSRNSTSSSRCKEHSDKIRKAVEDRQNKNHHIGDERRNILSELENVK